jgi:predicted RNase H-like HicB family nuclease
LGPSQTEWLSPDIREPAPEYSRWTHAEFPECPREGKTLPGQAISQGDKAAEEMNTKYALHIYWSDEDAGFIAVCEEFPGLSAFGESREQALREAQVALDAMIATYKQGGIPLPEPKRELIAA